MTELLRAQDLREFLKANVTVIAPGETLVVQVGEQLTATQVHEYQEALNWSHEDGGLPFRTLVVPGIGLGCVKAGPLMASLRALAREEVATELKRAVRTGSAEHDPTRRL